MWTREQGRKDEKEASLLTQGKKIFIAIHLLLGKPRGIFLPLTNCKKKKKRVSANSPFLNKYTHIAHGKLNMQNDCLLTEQV